MLVPSFSGLLKESAKIESILVIKNRAGLSFRKRGSYSSLVGLVVLRM